MRIDEEQGQQRLWEVLDALELSEKNQEIAKKYLDWEQPGYDGLLVEVEHQDFSELKQDMAVAREYKSYCLKREQKGQYGRLVKFVAAIGGATAYYVLIQRGYQSMPMILEFLTREQAVAMRAEGIAWNSYWLPDALERLSQKNQKVLIDAMKLCYHKFDNAKSLLAAAALYYSKPINGIVPLTSFDKERQEDILETVAFLEENLTSSLENIFEGEEASEEELRVLIAFVKESSVKDKFPPEIFRILSQHQTSRYLVKLLAGEAFLAIEHSKQCVAFVRLALAMDMQENRTEVLNICLHIGGQGWFFKHIEPLEDGLPMPKEDYILWCLKNCKFGSPVKRVIRNEPEVVRKLIKKVSTEEYEHLLAMTKDMNLLLYRELSAAGYDDFRQKLAQELTTCYKNGQVAAYQYLLGEAELDVLYPYIKEWRSAWDYDNKRCDKLRKLKKNAVERQMYRRAVVLEGLCMRTRYLLYYNGGYQRPQKETVTEIVNIFEAEQLPLGYQLDALCAVYDVFYAEKEKTGFINACVKVLCAKKGWNEAFTVQAKEGSALVRYLCVRVMDEDATSYKGALLSCAGDNSKLVREILTVVYTSHRDWKTEIVKMLESKKSKEREMAVQVLKNWGAEHFQEELGTALAREKSSKVKELLENCLGIENISPEAKKEQSEQELIKAILKGGKKRRVSWVYEKPVLELHKLDGTLASPDYLAAILVCYADMNTLGVHKDAVKLAANLNKTELSLAMSMVFERWMETGAESKKKWVLYAVSVHGGEEIVPVLYAQIQDWPKQSRGAMAAEAVKALALNGGPTALLLVDQIARKFKFRQVKTAAGTALAYAAKELGITKEELEDRIVPNLGFDERMEQIFDYGTRSFRVYLTSALELEVYDEQGKRLKNMPAPGKKDEPEKAKAANDAYKLLKKQLKTVVTNQKLRLEQAMSTERLWNVDKWKELFVKNPVMHQFATGLIWGLYADGKLLDTFRYMEDGSFNTVDEEEYSLPAEGTIGLIHPIELTEENLENWKEQLSDYEIVQPLEQMERSIYRLSEEEKKQTELTRFGGKLLNGMSLSGKLQNMGWYRGSVVDGGGYFTFYREDGAIGVELEFSGCSVGYENEEVTVYGVQFYKAGTVKRGSYIYDTIKEENRYLPGEVSARYVSEIILQLIKATISSTEQLEYPACKRR